MKTCTKPGKENPNTKPGQTQSHNKCYTKAKGQKENAQMKEEASNFGQMFERIINNRISKTINITEAQAGGPLEWFIPIIVELFVL